MSTSFGPLNADVCIGELVWPKFLESNHSEKQQRQLTQLAETSGKGMILDCSLVEVGNSEIVNLLMRLRNHVKKANKEIALFNVPQTLSETLRLCKLQSVLPAAGDAVAAKKLVCDLASGKGKLQMWFESHPLLGVVAIAALCIGIGLIGYLTLA